jgi:hypothetical protein
VYTGNCIASSNLAVSAEDYQIELKACKRLIAGFLFSQVGYIIQEIPKKAELLVEVDLRNRV